MRSSVCDRMTGEDKGCDGEWMSNEVVHNATFGRPQRQSVGNSKSKTGIDGWLIDLYSHITSLVPNRVRFSGDTKVGKKKHQWVERRGLLDRGIKIENRLKSVIYRP